MTPTPLSGSSLVLLVLLAGASLWSSAHGQTTDAGLNINFAQNGPANCSSTEFFDTSTLQCTTCPAGYYPSSGKLTCVTCARASGSYYNYTGGFSTAQSWSPTSFTSAANTSCACRTSAANTVLAEVYDYGVTEERCIACPNRTASTGSGDSAVCSSTAAGTVGALSPLVQLNAVVAILNNQYSAGINTVTMTTATFVVTSSTNSDSTLTAQVFNSLPLVNLLGPAANGCYRGSDRAACNAVANLCVLQLYNPNAAACAIYNSLVFYKTGVPYNPTTETQVPTGPLPWLYYGGTTYPNDAGVNVNVQMRGGSLASGSVSQLTFVLSCYALNGTWLGYRNLTTQLQICGAEVWQAAQWTNFGWNYLNDCYTVVGDIVTALASNGEPVFYDIFLQDGLTSLYPVPIQLSNFVRNVFSPTSGAVRRFFYMDGTLGIDSTNIAAGPLYVQYMNSWQMYVTLNKDPASSISPPMVFMAMTALSPTANAGQGLYAKFGVRYQNSDELRQRFWRALHIMLFVFLLVPGLLFLGYRSYWYYRNHQVSADDQNLILFIVLSIIDIGSFMLAIVLLFVTIYYVIVYKTQAAAYFMMLPNDALKEFYNVVIIAIVGQTVALGWSMWDQTRVDVFFLDWEKPRKVLNREGTNEKEAPVSCWRMLLVANEWNELQVQRYTSPAFTLITMTFIMLGLNVYTVQTITANKNDFTVYENTVSSNILRFGIEQAFFLVLLVGQVLWNWLIWHRFVSNPITNLVDLLFLANVSMVIMDDTHNGYYIHGQNRAAYSDVSMGQLNEELLKESSGVVAARGMVTDYQGTDNAALADNQTFLLYISKDVRDEYLKKRLDEQLAARSMIRSAKGLNAFLKGGAGVQEALVRGRDDVATLFKGMIDDAMRNHATQVINPSFVQMVVRWRPGTSTGTVFVHDRLNSFTSVTMMGVEFRLFTFEALFLCTIDMGIQNFAISAFITYVVIVIVQYVRQWFGQRNLAKKTLIDDHFLI